LLVAGCWLLVAGCWLLVAEINFIIFYFETLLLKFYPQNQQHLLHFSPFHLLHFSTF